MPLTILNVAYPLAPVGPDAVGGAEQVLTALDAALHYAGHRSIVVAREDSVTSGTLIPTPCWDGVLTEDVRERAVAAHRQAIARALQQWPVDVVHFHGVDFFHYLPSEQVPVLVTLHLPPEWYPAEIFRLFRPHTWLNCVSRAQRRACPDSPLLLPEIPNGIAVEQFGPPTSPGDYVLALGRMCPEKGFHLALDAAARANVDCLLGGQLFRYPAHAEYFEREIAPRLDDKRRFIGPVGFEQKRRLLSSARCLLAPSLVAETSSLVAMEALACGTPVIAFPSGALAELVEPGRTGYLVNDVQEMAEAIHAAAALSRDTCREVARSRFSLEAMVQKYFEVYTRIQRPNASGRGEQTSTEVRPSSGPRTVSLQVQEIRTLRGVLDLAPEWDNLWRDVVSTTPFQSPAWLIPWWRTLGEGELSVLALRRQSRLVGIAPLFIYRPERGPRTVLFMGAGNSDYLDVVLDNADATEGARAIFEYLQQRRQDWDICDFHSLRENSPLLKTPIAPPWAEERLRNEPCLILPLPRKNDLSQGLPAAQIRNWRYCRRRAEKAGALRLHRADAENLEKMLEAFFALHTARWSVRHGPGMLAQENIREFHRQSAPLLLSQNLLRMYALEIGDAYAAVLYGFVHQGKFDYYLGGFAPQFAPLSPGTLLVGHAIEEAVREGCREFDFLRGREPYKYKWGARDYPTWGLRLWLKPGRD